MFQGFFCGYSSIGIIHKDLFQQVQEQFVEWILRVDWDYFLNIPHVSFTKTRVEEK